MENYLQANQGQIGSPAGSGAQLPIRQQYAYNMTASPPQIVPQTQTRFVDSNPRPAKSPRHVAPSELPSGTSYPEYGRAYAGQFAGSSSAGMQAWTGAPEVSGIYGAPMPAMAPGGMQDPYHFQGEFPKPDQGGNPSTNYSWSSS
jgi:hypothetical protein